MINSIDSSDETSVNPVTSRRLFTLGCSCVTLAVVAAWWSSPLNDPLQIIAGISILVLGCLPGLLWARHHHPWFPCFEINTLTCVIFYALPLLRQHEGLKNYSDGVLELSGFLVTGYLATAILAFNAVKSPHQAPRWALQMLLPDDVVRYLPAGLLLNTAYVYIDRFYAFIPIEIEGSVRALCFGIGIITAFIFACEWGRGRLPRNMRFLFLACLALQVILLFSHLYLIAGIALLIISGIGYTTTRRRLPWLVLCICLPVVAVLHNGKSEMRKLYWSPNTPLPGVTELPSFFSQWIDAGLRKNDESDSSSIASKLAERASLFHMLCLSVDQVPAVRPYLEGESYIDIPAQVVPRFLWPEKPSSLLSNIRLALYFHLVDPNDPYSTSIAFGVISEAYVNFGVSGVLVLGALTGFIFKHLVLRSVGTPLFSSIGIFMILLTAWSFQSEQVLATWLASLFQASAVSIAVPLLYKKLFGTL